MLSPMVCVASCTSSVKHWLVLHDGDGHELRLPASSIRYLRETSQGTLVHVAAGGENVMEWNGSVGTMTKGYMVKESGAEVHALMLQAEEALEAEAEEQREENRRAVAELDALRPRYMGGPPPWAPGPPKGGQTPPASTEH